MTTSGPQKKRPRRRTTKKKPLWILAVFSCHASSCCLPPSATPRCSALSVEQLSRRPPPTSPPSPSSVPPLPPPPPPPLSVANVGGTVPERVIAEFAEKSSSNSREGVVGGERFFWLDRLGTDECALASERWHRRRQTPTIPAAAATLRQQQRQRPFSLLSWNVLSQTLYANPRKDPSIPQGGGGGGDDDKSSKRLFAWEERLQWILTTIVNADADVVCLQEVEFESYHSDLLPALHRRGYDGTVQGNGDVREVKRRSGKECRKHVVATFWKRRRFRPVEVTESKGVGFAHMARGRTLTCALQDLSGAEQEEEGEDEEVDEEVEDEEGGKAKTRKMAPPPTPQQPPTLAVVNCHLEGHPRQYAARIRQLQHAMEDLAKRRTCGPANLNGLTIAGDFNCELQSSACSTYLRIGRVGRKGGLGGVHGTSALAVPSSILESDEAAEILSPIKEWGHVLPNEDMENVEPHPFRRNSMLSAYPPQLGRRDPREHFTYCANTDRPVAGLDQIWHSGLSLTRVALRRMFPTQRERRSVLRTGLPALSYPSDHLPIGAVFDWNECDPVECAVDEYQSRSRSRRRNDRNKCADSGVRELVVTQDRAPPTPKPKSPVMAYAELDILLCTCPFDSDGQRQELESIIEDVPDLPPNNQKPSEEQLIKLGEMRERKKVLLMDATEPVRPTLQRILKLKKEVGGY